jgi:hypothetical protein
VPAAQSPEDSEPCAPTSRGTWRLGPLDLRPVGITSPTDAQLRIVARDTRRLHQDLTTNAQTVKVPGPLVRIDSLTRKESLSICGTAAHLLDRERLIIQVTPQLIGSVGSLYFPAERIGPQWSVTDRKDFRVPGAPRYRIAVWLGAGGREQPSRSRCRGFVLLASYDLDCPWHSARAMVGNRLEGGR